MDLIAAVGGIRQAESRVEDAARQLGRVPDASRVASSAVKDTVELSAEAVALLISRDSLAANIEVIKTQDGVGQALLDLLV